MWKAPLQELAEEDRSASWKLRKEDGKILGGSIIGPDASSLAGVLSLAVSCGLKAEDIADTVFAHPTTAEAIGEAAMGFGKGMINF